MAGSLAQEDKLRSVRTLVLCGRKGSKLSRKDERFKKEMPDFSNISQNEVMNRVPCAIQ